MNKPFRNFCAAPNHNGIGAEGARQADGSWELFFLFLFRCSYLLHIIALSELSVLRWNNRHSNCSPCTCPNVALSQLSCRYSFGWIRASFCFWNAQIKFQQICSEILRRRTMLLNSFGEGSWLVGAKNLDYLHFKVKINRSQSLNFQEYKFRVPE